MNIFRTLVVTSAVCLCASGVTSTYAQAPTSVVASAQAAMMTEKKVFSMPSYTTFGGKTIKNV